MRLCIWVCLALVPACVELPQTTATRRPRPPPEIGSSITHSLTCSCRACGEPRYCAGSEADEPKPEPGCDQSYDFSASEGCALRVESTASRCFQRVWRVKLSQGCERSRPPECCS